MPLKYIPIASSAFMPFWNFDWRTLDEETLDGETLDEETLDEETLD